MSLTVQNATNQKVRTAALLEAGIRLLKEEGMPEVDVDVLLTDDIQIQELNLQYRNFDKPTDVLSFSLRESLGDEPAVPELNEAPIHLGDVAISIDTATKQAALHGVSLEQELSLLAVHGILHLLGYEDETFEGAAEMRSREKDILNFSYPAFAFPE